MLGHEGRRACDRPDNRRPSLFLRPSDGRRYITHLNTAWNSHAKNASVRRRAPLRSLPTLFIQITPFLFDLVFLGLISHQLLDQCSRYPRHVGNIVTTVIQSRR